MFNFCEQPLGLLKLAYYFTIKFKSFFSSMLEKIIFELVGIYLKKKTFSNTDTAAR